MEEPINEEVDCPSCGHTFSLQGDGIEFEEVEGPGDWQCGCPACGEWVKPDA